MCGHFGVAGFGIVQEDLRVFRELGIISQLRGLDGSGVYEIALRGVKYERFMKTDEDFCSLLYHSGKEKKASNRILGSLEPDVIMGHVRAATIGVIDPENSHPFAHGNIVGAHNGTLIDHKYNLKTSDKTDSEQMFIDISERGIVPVLQEMDPDSAYAIVMVDKKERKLYFARNDKRTLYFAINYKRDVIYWASESAMLNMVLNRNGIQYHYKKEDGNFGGGTFALNDGRIYSTTIAKIKNTNAEIFKEEAVIYSKLEGKKIFFNAETDRKYNTPVVVIRNANNVTRFLPDNTKKNTPLAKNCFIEECVSCQKELNLYEQYRIKSGDRGIYSQGHFMCDDCTIPETLNVKKEA